jgi:hypothetical protein
MAPKLPDPLAVARTQADAIKAERHMFLEVPLQRVLNDAPFVDRDSLLAGLHRFHAERMAKVPSKTKYPESTPWVDHVLAVDRELKKLANLSDADMAMLRSLHHYLMFRGFAKAQPSKGGRGKAPLVMAEKCRIVFHPNTDRGAIHIKNVDDPCTHFKTDRTPPKGSPWSNGLVIDGVGSGLHIDDEPEEIFPLNALTMVHHYTDETPGAREFLTRYKSFWGGANEVIRDAKKRHIGVEKCSYNHIEFFEDPQGYSHCSGMVCRDPKSPQGKYQAAKRNQYLEKFGQPKDGPDQVFWDACDIAEHKLADGMKKLGPKPKADDIFKLFLTEWPNGLHKAGAKLHPNQSVEEYTLVTHATLIDEKAYYRWQRDDKTLKLMDVEIHRG